MSSRLQASRQLTVNIVVVGSKQKTDTWITLGIDVFESRLKPIMKLNTVYVKNDQQLIKTWNDIKMKGKGGDIGDGVRIALDENGIENTSHEFHKIFYKGIESSGSTISFAIGGANGLPVEIKKSSSYVLSLSKMTWTHQMARLLLIEQIYRSSEIQKVS